MRTETDLTMAISRHADMVKRICMMHLKNTADTEDIFQTVFMKYLMHDEAFQSAEHEKAWMIRVTINACRDLLRSFFRSRIVTLDAVPEPAMPESDNTLRWIVSALPAKYRDVIYLHYYEKYTAAEIGDILNKSENTVYTQLARGRQLLKEQLGGEW